MRFFENGPNIPDELLTARDLGDVIFFCGAGVSQHQAKLPGFAALADEIVDSLGSARESPARRLLAKVKELGSMAGVGGLVATDRIFGLLQREFESVDIRADIAAAIKPKPGYQLGAHRTLIDLATRQGRTRLVTTNFDLLFEEAAPHAPVSGPPRLPDPRDDRAFDGIVHLHGRVDPSYSRAEDDELVISSAEFGRAYLSDGWATRFIQDLLVRFHIVFVGYSADDPPVQYLLEALNLQAEIPRRLYAFQAGNVGEATALWEHRGVQAIAFDSAGNYAALWDTLTGWAERNRDFDAWHDRILRRGSAGPHVLSRFERGQIARVLATAEGAKRLAALDQPLGAEWLLVADASQRYARASELYGPDDAKEVFEPFKQLGLDEDIVPKPFDLRDRYAERRAPQGALDLFVPNSFDRAVATAGALAGLAGHAPHAPLPPRLVSLGHWLQRVAHQPIALWWAAGQPALNEQIQNRIEYALRQESQRFSEPVRRGWRLLFAAWGDRRPNADMIHYELAARGQDEGWSRFLVRDLANIYTPRLEVKPSWGLPHPLRWNDLLGEDNVLHVDVDYPMPHAQLSISDEHLDYAVSLFQQKLELAVSLEREIRGDDRVYLETTHFSDDGSAVTYLHGLTALIALFQNLVTRLSVFDVYAARAAVRRWPATDRFVFARLRIFAAGSAWLDERHAAYILLNIPDDVFWGTDHERDLLYALRDRWSSLKAGDRSKLERRLRKSSYPWDIDAKVAKQYAASQRLRRLHWLSTHGVTFTFDLEAEMTALRRLAPDWEVREGETIADSRAPVVYGIETDNRPDPLLNLPLVEILPQSRQLAQREFLSRVQLEPFRGLASQRPARALAVLTLASRSGDFAAEAWKDFLSADARSKDQLRLITVIVGRLCRLEPSAVARIAYPISSWMETLADRLYGDAAKLADALWTCVIAGLQTDSPAESEREDDWATPALNAPVGKLVAFLLKDPRKNNLKVGEGFPSAWLKRADDLIALPGDWRRHALVMLGHQISWLYWVDPIWTEQRLLPWLQASETDANALWEGVLWSGRIPQPALFKLVKNDLVRYAARANSRRDYIANIAGFFLGSWAIEPKADGVGPVIDGTELREIILNAENTFRERLLWQLWRWLSDEKNFWLPRVVLFLRKVWPKQRALRLPGITARLASLALASGDRMPEIVELILPRLIKLHTSTMIMIPDQWLHDNFELGHPAALLDLFWTILPDDASQWPFKADAVIRKLSEMPDLSSDRRLGELRRRLDDRG